MFYLVRRTDDVVVGSNKQISTYPNNGLYVVPIPEGVSVNEANRTGPNNTFTSTDIVEEKYNGLLRKYT